MKKIIFAIITMFALTANAQETVEATVSADVVSKYVWRGAECGKGAIQPTLGVAYKGLSLAAWGSYGIVESGDTEEFDLTLSYTTGGLTVGVTDYWFSGGDNRYFLYDAHKTAHVFEANVGYDFGVASVNWYTNFAGADGMNKDGKRAYSSYAEVAAPFKLGGCDWEAALGLVPFATSYYETTGLAVTNLSLKATYDVKVTPTFTLPVFAQLAGNPRSQKAFMILGFTINVK